MNMCMCMWFLWLIWLFCIGIDIKDTIKSFCISILFIIPIGVIEYYGSITISEIYGYDKILVLKIIATIVISILTIISIAICIWCDRKLKEEKEISMREIAILEKYSKLITEDNCIEMIKEQNKEIEAMKREVRHSRL